MTAATNPFARTLAALALCVVLPLGACGGDDDDGGSGLDPGQPEADGGFEPEDAPQPEASTAAGPAVLDDAVPIPNDATPSGDATTDGGTTSQSYLVEGVTAEQLINDYQQLAEGAGWTADGPPTATGSTDWSLTMTDGARSLVVTTAPAGDDAESDQTELSLQVTSAD